MHRLIALYNPPADPQAFRDHLSNVHLPIVARFPGLRALRVGYGLAVAEGISPYFAIVECDFDNAASTQHALSSSEGAEAAADVPNYASAGVTILTYNFETFPL